MCQFNVIVIDEDDVKEWFSYIPVNFLWSSHFYPIWVFVDNI